MLFGCYSQNETMKRVGPFPPDGWNIFLGWDREPSGKTRPRPKVSGPLRSLEKKPWQADGQATAFLSI